MTVEQKKRKEQAIQYYISQGYAPHVAAAIVGNLIHESGLKTEVRGDLDNPQGDAVGIAQWRLDRQKQLKNTYGKDWNKFENQLEFVHLELQNSHKLAGEKLKTAKTVEEAGEIFSDLYEKPKVKYKQDKDRQARVNETFKSINPDFTNLDKAQNISTFAQELQATPQPQAQQEEEETEELEPEIQEAQQKVKEYSFLKDIEELYQLPPQQQVQLTPQETAIPTIDVLGTYEQASQIIDNPIMQQGGVKKPIYVESENDPRYKAYQDSLSAYNISANLKKQVEKTKQFPDVETNNKTTFSITGEGKSMLPKTKLEKLLAHPESDPRRDFSKYNEGTGKSMKPVDVLKYPSDKWYSLEAGTLPIYKKPQQPVEIRKEKTDLRPIYVSDKNDPRINQYTESGRQYLYKNPEQQVLFQQQRPTLTPLNLQPKGIQNIQTTPQTSNQELRPTVNAAKYLNVRDTTVLPMGNQISEYRWDGSQGELRQISEETYPDGTRKNTRFIEPVYQQGGIPTSPNGLYDYPNQPVLVNTKDGKITMKNIDYEVLGIDEFGNKQLMQPNKEYQFKGKNILEIPTQFFNGKK